MLQERQHPPKHDDEHVPAVHPSATLSVFSANKRVFAINTAPSMGSVFFAARLKNSLLLCMFLFLDIIFYELKPEHVELQEQEWFFLLLP